jgi:hypothetical protein
MTMFTNHDRLSLVQTVPIMAIIIATQKDVAIGTGCRTRGALPRASKWTATKKITKNSANVPASPIDTLLILAGLAGAWGFDEIREAGVRKGLPHFSQKMRPAPTEAPQ